MGNPEPHIARPDHERCARLNRRLRQAFIEGAEVDMRRLLGRGLTAEELERISRHYPGDVRSGDASTTTDGARGAREGNR